MNICDEKVVIKKRYKFIFIEENEMFFFFGIWKKYIFYDILNVWFLCI